MDSYPIIQLSTGQSEWEDGWEIGRTLEVFFPREDAVNFAQACANNSWGPVLKDGSLQIEGLLMLQQGEHDGGDWTWLVRAAGHHFTATGGCDYTGWDCQSDLRWSILPPLSWSVPVDSQLIPRRLDIT